MTFVKGQSGNPYGKPKIYKGANLTDIARRHTGEAVETLVFWMRSDNARAAVTAAQALLDRGWGKAVQPIADGSAHDALNLDLSSVSASKLARMESALIELLSHSSALTVGGDEQAEIIEGAVSDAVRPDVEPVNNGDSDESGLRFETRTKVDDPDDGAD